MQRFYLNRLLDVSGVSGTGFIAEGCIFSNGKVVLQWLTEHSSMTIFDSMEQMQAVHGHQGATIVFLCDVKPSSMPRQ